MARALVEKTKAERHGSHTVSSSVPHESTCARCGGLMVTDFYMDLLFCIGETEFAAKRCVQCGEIVDSVILCNREITHDPVTPQPPEKVATNNHATNVHEVPRAGPAEVDDRRGKAMQPDHRSRKTEQVSFSHRGRRRESARRLPLR
jgi:hypothetical protein